MNFKVERTEGGLFRVTGDDIGIHVTAQTIPKALRRVADLFEKMEKAKTSKTS